MPLLILVSMATMLLTGKSYNYMPTIFLFFLIGYKLYSAHSLMRLKVFMSSDMSLRKDILWVKAILFSLLCFFGIHVVYMIGFHEKFKILDNPYKSVVFIPILLYWIQSNIEKSIRAFFLGSAFGGIIGGIVGTYGYFILHLPRAFGEQYMYIQAGDMSMTLGIFSLLGLFYKSSPKQIYKTIMVLGMIGGMWGSIISGSRGGWMILLPAAIFIVYIYRKVISKKILLKTIGIALVIIAGAVATPQTGIWQRYMDMKHDVHQYENNHVNTSLGLRFNMWKGAWHAIEEKPLIGWGVTGAQNLKKEQVKQGILVKEASEFTQVHNQPLNDWYERGILGLLTGLGIFIVPGMWFWRVIKKYSIHANSVIMACAGILHVAATFSYGLSQGFLEHNSGNVFFFFTLILIISLLWQTLKENESYNDD